MIQTQREIAVAAAATLLLLFGAGQANARHDSGEAGECRKARTMCLKEGTAAIKVCKDACRDEIQDAISAAQAVCDEQNLDEETCRALVKESVSAVSASCRQECKEDRKEHRLECREALRECRAAVLDPLDDECVMECREGFQECREAAAPCQQGCRDLTRDAIQSCRDADLDRQGMRECVREAHKAGHACSLECSDTSMCHGDLRTCLSECPVEEP